MNQDIYKMNLELLLMAKELVVNEYVDRRAEVHNKWLVESDHLWKTQRLRLAYPTIPAYPTEAEIINRAQKLIEFVANNEILPVKETVDIVDSEQTQEPTITESTETETENISQYYDETASTHTDNTESVSDITSETKNNSDVIPEKILEYTAIKVASELKDGQPASSKIMTNILGKIKDITGKKET